MVTPFFYTYATPLRTHPEKHADQRGRNVGSFTDRLFSRNSQVLIACGLSLIFLLVISINYYRAGAGEYPSMINVEFVGDPYLADLDPKALQGGYYEQQVKGTFGLPLVAAWRSFPPTLEPAYRELVTRVSSCFVSTTGHDEWKEGPEAEAHIYPFDDLHVSIATFRTSLDPMPANNDCAETIKKFCSDVVGNASKRDSWPKVTQLRLRPKEIRLGKKNAIIIWEETTGNLETMRMCVREEMEAQQYSARGDNGIDLVSDYLSFSVPNIVHSTFIRFWKSPSNPDGLKKIFKGSALLDILPTEVHVDARVKLVYESSACMHVSDDDSHVLWRES